MKICKVKGTRKHPGSQTYATAIVQASLASLDFFTFTTFAQTVQCFQNYYLKFLMEASSYRWFQKSPVVSTC